MFRAQRPADRRRPPPANETAANDDSAVAGQNASKTDRRLKRCRSPCEDELRYKELQARAQAVKRDIRQQEEQLARLEESILDFYYTHTVRYEPLLTLSGEAPALAQSAAGVTTDATKSPWLAELFPELHDGTALTRDLSSDAVEPPMPCAAPAKTRYYYTSALMQLYREAAIQERDLALNCAAEEARVAEVEATVQRDIIDGALAAQLSAEREEQTSLAALVGTLTALQSQCTAEQAALQAVEARVAEMEKSKAACLARKTALEAKKQEQMDNAERIKEEVAAFRQCVEASANDLEQRRQVNRDLEAEISRRRAAARSRRKKE